MSLSKPSYKFPSCDQRVNKNEKSANFVNEDDRVLFRHVALVQHELVRSNLGEHEGRVVAIPPREGRDGPLWNVVIVIRSDDGGQLVHSPTSVVSVS